VRGGTHGGGGGVGVGSVIRKAVGVREKIVHARLVTKRVRREVVLRWKERGGNRGKGKRHGDSATLHP
jgi:hypothetical protein